MLVYIGAIGLLILGIYTNFNKKMKWYILIPIELILMAMVIIGTSL